MFPTLTVRSLIRPSSSLSTREQGPSRESVSLLAGEPAGVLVGAAGAVGGCGLTVVGDGEGRTLNSCVCVCVCKCVCMCMCV